MATLPHEGTYSVMYGNLTVSVGSGYRRGYLARPDQAGRWPVVILAHDLDGLGAHEKYIARRLARRGVAVLAVELYDERPDGEDAGLRAYNDLTDGQALRVLDETHEYLSSDDIGWAHTNRIGMIGLDVGGRFALITAAHRSWVGASALAYTPLTDEAQARNPGGQWLLYAGARHGFLDEVGANFDAAAFEDAIVRLSDFFIRHLPAAEIIDLG